MNQSLFNVGSAGMRPPRDDTLVRIDEEMQAYHREIKGKPYDILAAGYMGNCGGFFQQYLSGGEENVRDKSYLTGSNRKLAEELAESAAANGRSISEMSRLLPQKLNFPRHHADMIPNRTLIGTASP